MYFELLHSHNSYSICQPPGQLGSQSDTSCLRIPCPTIFVSIPEHLPVTFDPSTYSKPASRHTKLTTRSLPIRRPSHEPCSFIFRNTNALPFHKGADLQFCPPKVPVFRVVLSWMRGFLFWLLAGGESAVGEGFYGMVIRG